MSYMSVDRTRIQTAFALAHKLACNPDTPAPQRNQFRAVASLIWQACGEEKEIPAQLPAGFPGTERPANVGEAIEKGRRDYLRVTGQE